MKFNFLIIDLNDGIVSGTNKSSVANDFMESQDHIVIDTASQRHITAENPAGESTQDIES